MAGKSEHAFRTIGELADELGVPQHILRYWETRFPQLKPLQRAGNRRYYRPDDVALARRIHRLLNQEGYTIRGVQRVLGEKGAPDAAPQPSAASPNPVSAVRSERRADDLPQLAALQAIRSALLQALEDTRV